MNIITEAFKNVAEFNSAVLACKKNIAIQVTGVCGFAHTAFCAALYEETYKKQLIILENEKDAYKIAEEFTFYSKIALVFPARDFILDNIMGYSREWEYTRLNILMQILNNKYDIIITVPDAVMQYTIPKEILISNTLELKKGEKIPLNSVVQRLVNMGYNRAELVEGRGQFSVRGGIIDIYSPQNDYPVRIDFWGDEIDSIGSFDPINQRRFEKLSDTLCIPSSEVIIDENSRNKITLEIDRMQKHLTDEKVKNLLNKEKESLLTENKFHTADKYFSIIYNKKETILDYLDNFQMIIIDSKRVADRAAAFSWKFEKSRESYATTGILDYKNSDLQYTDSMLIQKLGSAVLCLDMFISSTNVYNFTEQFMLNVHQMNSFSSGIEVISDDIKNYLKNNYKILMLCATDYAASNLVNILLDMDLPAYIFAKNLYEGKIAVAASNSTTPIGGFELPASNFILLTDAQSVKGRLKSSTLRNIKNSNTEKIVSYSDLAVGDLVVHINHGIGKYEGITNLTVAGVSKDYIKLQYRGTDVLYVPCNQLDMISKFIGGSKETQPLSKLGGIEWQNAKARVKKAAKDIAKDLIQLYAERNRQVGFSFSKDDELQNEFESVFEYIETDGQLRAANEIKKDMEKSIPMDRLLCGDVGFGKTEVAFRAVFKCVRDSKQCAILVPTTILAWQHYQTMLARFRAFPIKVDVISRFKTKQAQTDTLIRLKKGEIDVIVGTHRLIQRDVIFKNLGLLIVDEEQRFGVAHKEKLKQLAKNVDVLTLTATPIPRTLNMALSGIRDMSLLEEAPMDRQPVQTFVLEHDDVIISEAIKSELRRGGQVFYLHNNIESIYGCASKLQQVFPDANIGVAHGQMKKDELSDIWESLVEGETDVLVCTTIIETGVDVPNANTLIIEDANNFGLSQLHQIRGRVGRSYRKSYAYFTFKPNKIMTEIAEKRLEAIREFTEFGSGYKIAMRDLELRGAGNILGVEQHGNMEAVGYDLYVQILEEAVLEEKGETIPEKRNAQIDIAVDAYIPEKYIFSPQIRIDIYKKIASIENENDSEDLRNELIDRFGKIPKSVSNLIDISQIRNTAINLKFTSIEQTGNKIFLYSENLMQDETLAIIKDKDMRGKIMLSNGTRKYIAYKLNSGESALEAIKRLFLLYTKISHN
ncbi:MAG: transcription-repair coupling factor [Clostridiales bacterium GWF2_38_85]|nr:MAG: transcription-repair coupling factor [Clostridiales bacterium GWF2_38_85]HBL84070.1 transcription-repair coupling factor [Clostridiales bacterium]